MKLKLLTGLLLVGSLLCFSGNKTFAQGRRPYEGYKDMPIECLANSVNINVVAPGYNMPILFVACKNISIGGIKQYAM